MEMPVSDPLQQISGTYRPVEDRQRLFLQALQQNRLTGAPIPTLFVRAHYGDPTEFDRRN